MILKASDDIRALAGLSGRMIGEGFERGDSSRVYMRSIVDILKSDEIFGHDPGKKYD